MTSPTSAKRGQAARLSGVERCAEILTAAARLAVTQGYFPLPLEALGREVGVSKSLIYVYFPTQQDLVNRLAEAHLSALVGAGWLSDRGRESEYRAAMSAARKYFDHVANSGPLLHILFADGFAAHALSRSVKGRRDRMILPLARVIRKQLHMPPAESVTLVNLLLVIVEQAGRQVFAKELEREAAWGLCEDILTASIESLAPPDSN